MKLKTFASELPRIRAIFGSMPHPRKALVEQMVRKFEADGFAISQTGATALLVAKWLRENNRSYQLLWHAKYDVFVIRAATDEEVGAVSFRRPDGPA